MNVARAIAARYRARWLGRVLGAGLAALFLGLLPAAAQDMGTVVQSCGNIAQQYTVGTTRPIQVDTNGNLCIGGGGSAGSGSGGFPVNAIPQDAFATGTTAGATATLPATVGQFTYLCGIHVEVGSATAAIPVTVTATGLKGGTFTSSANAPVTAATATAGPIVSQTFSPCMPSSGVNTAIVVSASALGAGGVNQNVNAWGYQQ